jgi:hypothetical protein
MKYLKEFENEADVKVFVKPNVVLANDTGNVLYNVEPVKGVFIQHIDGTLYTTSQWTSEGFSNDLANGVAVCNGEVAFVMAKKVYTYIEWSSDTTTLIDGVTTTEDKDVAKADFAGKENTKAILKTDTSEAAYRCGNYVFPNGQKGYLPALGELCAAMEYGDEVWDALTLLGMNHSTVAYFLSSTQKNATEAWVCKVFLGGVTYGEKSVNAGSTVAVAITALL